MVAWIVASVLPLPLKPLLRDEESQTRSRSKAERDLEKAIVSIDEARYENARWWRNINRIMAVLGLLVIGAMVSCDVRSPSESAVLSDISQIALAVVAVRVRG